jgi:transcriptional regulator with XRE-family HTH domain
MLELIIKGINFMTSSEMKRIRLHLNWSQEHLARQLGISLRSVSRYEAEDTPIPNPVAIAVKSFADGGGLGRARNRKIFKWD